MSGDKRHLFQHLGGFLVEVAIVVIGVVLALWGGQWVENGNWRQKTRALEADMRTELMADDLPKAVGRIANSACLFQALDHISEVAERGGDRSDVVAAARSYRIGLTTWDMEAWRTLLAADSAGHISVERLHTWYRPYAFIPELQRLAQKERDDLAHLRGLRDAPGPLSDAEKVDLAHDLEALRTSNRHILAFSQQFMKALKAGGLTPSPRMIDQAFAGIDPDELGPCARRPGDADLYGATTAEVGQPRRQVAVTGAPPK